VNTTVVPHGPLAFLTVWPYRLLCGDGPVCQPQILPPTSTLNAFSGGIVSNGTIVGASLNTYATSTTDLILDVSGFFAP
jgi:hypothetical protein